MTKSARISGLVVEYIVAIDVTRVRFPADAYFLSEPWWRRKNQGCYCVLSSGDLAQMVERSLSMREALGSMPRFSTFFVQEVFQLEECRRFFADLPGAALIAQLVRAYG